MSSIVINVKVSKKCAFCKYWYDPANSYIAPQAPTIGLWKILNDSQKCLCSKKNSPMPATAFCNNYICKL